MVYSAEWKEALCIPWAVEVQSLGALEPVEVQSSLNFEKVQSSPFEFLHLHASQIWGWGCIILGMKQKES